MCYCCLDRTHFLFLVYLLKNDFRARLAQAAMLTCMWGGLRCTKVPVEQKKKRKKAWLRHCIYTKVLRKSIISWQFCLSLFNFSAFFFFFGYFEISSVTGGNGYDNGGYGCISATHYFWWACGGVRKLYKILCTLLLDCTKCQGIRKTSRDDDRSKWNLISSTLY